MVVEMSSGPVAGEEVSLPGRLGDPGRTLGTDPRADPRMVAALAAAGLDQRGEAPPVTPSSPREERQQGPTITLLRWHDVRSGLISRSNQKSDKCAQNQGTNGYNIK